jgi:site-specific DNA recombinase
MSGTVSQTEAQVRVAAIYARVSSERQRQEQTIQSQTAALRELAEQRGLLVPEDLVFEDDGFSGASLQRPALERLRDRAFEGCFVVLLCHAPDRLARRYAYQVLLLEELARGGIEVVFAKEPERSGSPEDELLRQFQGMIAEYERAQIAERCRRGKLHRARAGAVSVLSHAPYGYRYVKKSEHADAFYEIDELEAPIVREIFRRYVEQGESIVQIARWLSKRGVPTRTGKPRWSQSTVWAILRNPAYTGQAAFGRRRVTGAPAKPTRLSRQGGRHSGRSAYEHVGPEHWQRIPVPALIAAEQHALAQELLARNGRLSARNTRRVSLLQGILVCRECGHAYYRSSTRSRAGNVHHYYRCSGSDSFRRPEGRVCGNRPVRVDEIDELVWTQVLALLENPALIQAEIERRLETLRAEHPASHRRDRLQRDLTRAQNALRRLIDGYQEQLITLEELRTRTPELRKRETTLRAELDALDTELQNAETYLKLTETLDAFRARLSATAENLPTEQRQEIVRLVVREVLLGNDDITVRHSIPIPTGGQPAGSLLRTQSQGAAEGDPQRLRRGARAEMCPSQGAQRDRPSARARTAAGQAAIAASMGARGSRSRARPAPPTRRRARPLVSRRGRLAARRDGGDAHGHPPRRHRLAQAHAREHEPVRVDDRDRPPHPTQRETLVIGRDGAALDRRRHARSRTPVSEDHRLPRPRHPRRRDRTRPRPPPSLRRCRSHLDEGGRYRRSGVTITPGPPSRNSTALGTSSRFAARGPRRVNAHRRCWLCMPPVHVPEVLEPAPVLRSRTLVCRLCSVCMDCTQPSVLSPAATMGA